ncbi:unnamed protein product [Moneuplotes crassus]|uniref:Uncharacterized protein n=1 Tax=Euplotes crassus TaxID=5936 RepID=A0AAD1XLR5_EUPCR|nr:unnamed protein product [Moneuplotes crassus]
MEKTQNSCPEEGVEKYVFKAQKEFERRICASVHLEERNARNFTSDSSSLVFYFWILEDLLFINRINPITIPRLNKIIVHDFSKRNHKFESFLANCFPIKVSGLFLQSRHDTVPITPYFNHIMKASGKITVELGFDNFNISEKQFKRIISTFKHVWNIKLTGCKLSVTKVIDFSAALNNLKLRSLSFERSGQVNRSNWKKNIHEFDNLIKGLATSEDLKQSLRWIYLKSCRLNKEITKNLITSSGFSNAKIYI